jgi:hypothetical protein
MNLRLHLLLAAIFLVIAARAQYPGMKQHRYNKHRYHRSHHGLNINLPDYEMEEGDWLLYGGGTFSSFENPSPYNFRSSYGLSAEYFFFDRFSIRGGAYVSPYFLKLTPAPLGVLVLQHPDLLYYSNDAAKALFVTLLSLAMNDGVGYNFHIGPSLFLMPYLGTWQVELNGDWWSDDTSKVVVENDLCSFGLNLKYFIGQSVVLNADAEYNRLATFSDKRWGYHVNFHLGFLL